METRVWTDVLAEGDVKLLEDVQVMSSNLISQVYIFIDLFHQYIDLVQSAAIFSPEFVEPDQNNAKVSPTQTPPKDSALGDHRSRAERKAREKKKTPFDVIQGQK